MARTRGAKSSLRQAARELHKDPVQGSHRASATTASHLRAILRASAVSATTYRFSDSLRHAPEPLSDFSRAQGLLPSAPEVSYGAFADSQGFFLSRVAMDFYQSMTTHHVRDPTVIHFTIDGRHGILGARHIAEALRIPYEPASPEDYRVWTHPSQSDIVRILSRGHPTQYLLRKELPPSMFFIDALLRHNIFPLQHWVQRRGVLLEALFGYLRDSSLALIISLWPLFCTLKRRSIRRSCSEPMLFHFFPQIVMSDSGALGVSI
ncbi:hypothetical protein CK203_116851 [Vitis vinifera]|uniref:Uncharacterized protein n=1 Tax=Vitis vinifera TaxID=29760 RepID=A0A438FD24_VITVI|nr:hypothetical protein CK203_116851 [Vitis vinifera]